MGMRAARARIHPAVRVIGRPRLAPVLLVCAGALAQGCAAQTRFEAVRTGWARRGGGHAFELAMPSIEVGPGGPRAQSLSVAVVPRMVYGGDESGRVEGAVQLRAHLWRAHHPRNLWRNTDAPFDPRDPNLRRVPCRGGAHVQRYAGRAYTESFSVGAVVEGAVAGVGRWVPDGYDARGRPRSTLSDLRLDGSVAAGVFARMLTPYGFTFNLDAGWAYEDGASGPFVRAGVGMAFDLSVDGTQPRLPEDG